VSNRERWTMAIGMTCAGVLLVWALAYVMDRSAACRSHGGVLARAALWGYECVERRT
jgi:hypothetical protein